MLRIVFAASCARRRLSISSLSTAATTTEVVE